MAKGHSLMKAQHILVRMAALVLIVAQAGCFTPPNPARESTVEALAKKLSATITAAAEDNDSANEIQSAAVVEATSTAASVATQAATEAVDTASLSATAEFERPVRAEVPFFGVDGEKGQVGWIHPSFTLEAQGQEGFANRNDFAGVVAEDFVVSADITWNTQFGDSGCGFVLRSDGNPNVPSQYIVLLTRFANGHIGFLVISKGELVNGADLYPRSSDRKFKSDNDTTNQLTIVGRGNLFEIYTNGVLIGVVDPNVPPSQPDIPPLPEQPQDEKGKATFQVLEQNQGQVESEIRARFTERQTQFKDANKEFPRGFISMVAVTQGGKVSCKFDNAWLYLIDK
jgi:hypothetical protein